MKPSNQNIGNDPTIMGNERPRQDRNNDNLPRDTRVQEEDPRNGMNQPADDTSRPGRSAQDDEDNQ